MLFQYPDPPSTDPGCPSFPERSEGLFAPLSEAIQPGPNALHLDQRAGTFPAHHRSNQAVPSSSSLAAKAEEGESRYYKELTVRCTRALPWADIGRPIRGFEGLESILPDQPA